MKTTYTCNGKQSCLDCVDCRSLFDLEAMPHVHLDFQTLGSNSKALVSWEVLSLYLEYSWLKDTFLWDMMLKMQHC